MRLAQKRTIQTYDHAPQHKVSVWARHIGRTSFTFRIAGSEAIISTAETIYVLVDSATLSKTPLPLDVTQALQKGGQGLVADHAGYLTQGE